MNQQISATQLFRKSLDILKDKWIQVLAVTIFYFIISSIPGYFGIKVQLLSLLIMGPLSLGISKYFLKVIRGQELTLETLFEGFNQYASSTIAYIVGAILIILGLLCFIVPGIILALGLAPVYFILADYPKMEGIDALRSSWEIMKGNKREFLMVFLLQFAIVICGLLALIVGVIFAIPIVYTMSALFYDQILRKVNNQNE